MGRTQDLRPRRAKQYVVASLNPEAETTRLDLSLLLL